MMLAWALAALIALLTLVLVGVRFDMQRQQREAEYEAAWVAKRAQKPDCKGCGRPWFSCTLYDSDLCPACGAHRAHHGDAKARVCAAEILAKAGTAAAPHEGGRA